MDRFNIDLKISASTDRVFRAFWDLADWPAITPHVSAIEMHFEDRDVQILTMHVETAGRHDRFKSVRVRQPGAIFFFQPAPPPLLHLHRGWWSFSPSGAATLLSCTHLVEVDLEQAATILRQLGHAARGARGIRAAVRELLENNSLQTMRALKQRLERKEQDDVAPLVYERMA